MKLAVAMLLVSCTYERTITYQHVTTYVDPFVQPLSVHAFFQSSISCTPLSFVFSDEILSKIKEAGFEVAMTKEMHLSREQAEEFYSEHRDKDFFESLMTHMSRCVCVRGVVCFSTCPSTYMQLCRMTIRTAVRWMGLQLICPRTDQV